MSQKKTKLTFYRVVENGNDDCLDTCLVPQNSADHVYTNNGCIRKVFAETYVVSPGESKFPTNWLANNDFVAKSFPCFFPSGRNTLSDEREKKISTQQFFCQRIMNKNSRFAENSACLFCAQQRVQREQLERQCDVLFRKRKTERIDSGTIKINQDDVQTVFHPLRGTGELLGTNSLQRSNNSGLSSIFSPSHVRR